MEQNQNTQQQGMQNNQQPASFYQEYQQPVYTPVAAKKKLNSAVIIVPAVILVAAAVVLFIILLNGKGGYRGAEQRYFSQMFSGLSSAVSEASEVDKEPQSITVSFSAANSEVADSIGFSDISFQVEAASKGDDIYAYLNLDLGGDSLEGEMWYDENGELMLYIPDISSIYLRASLSAQEETNKIDSQTALDALSDVFSKTMETYFEVVGDTKIEGGQKFLVNGVAYTADKVEIKLDKVQVATVAKAFLENLVNNDEAMDILCAYYGGDKEEVLETLKIEDAIDELEDIIEEKDGSDGSFEMTVWMQGGSIIGRDIVITTYSGTGNLSFYQIPVSGGSVTYFELLPDDFRYFNEDKVSGDLHSGTAILTLGDDTVTVEYEDIAVTDKLFQGEAEIEVSGMGAFQADIELESSGDTREIVVSIPNILELRVTMEPSQLRYEDMPSPSSDVVAYIDTDGDFLNDDNFNKFINDVSIYLMIMMGIF